MSNQKTTLTKPYATHQGKWVIDEKNNLYIECYVTNEAQRMLSLRGTARTMDLRGGGSTALARNLKSQWIQPYLTDGLKKWLDDVANNNITKISGKQGSPFVPFEASLFVDVCKAYVQAKNDGVFSHSQWESQSKIADRLLKVMSAFAKIGIVAIIDEVTGYQEERERDELQKLLAKYISEEFLPWARRFPSEFYKEMFRLKGWEYRGSQKPPLVGKITNLLVYEQLPEGVLDELRRKNPVVIEKGYRRYKHHQFLTEETGIPHLDKHLASVVTLMKAFDNWKEFEAAFQRVFGLSSQENLNFASKKKKQR